MNWKKISLVAAISSALIAPAAMAQSRGSHGGGRGSLGGAVSAGASGGHVAQGTAGGTSGSHRGSWNGGQNGNWRGGHDHWRHHRHGFYPRYYSGYFGSPFGYPYGYGYGFPYFGTSAAFYYNGYGNGNGYSDRARGGSVVVEVQQELARAGYYRGAIDGVIGNGTRGAIRRFERANRLPVDGRIDQQLLSRMGLD
ncbi:MAG: peptidoglycan-binding domain-containing protein [Chthoniobacterales bacterium]